MMTSKSVNTGPDNDTDIFTSDEASHSVEELLSKEEVTTPSQTSSEKNTNTVESEKEAEDKTTVRLELPEPDAENITVLSHKLPNKPILPWNRYDSPWEGSEGEHPETVENEEKPEQIKVINSSNIEQEEKTHETKSHELEVDEVD